MLDGKIPPEDLEVMKEIIETLDQRKAFYGSIRIKTALCKDKDVWKNLVTKIELMHKNEQQPSDRRIEYPNLLISDFTDTVKSLTSLTSNLVTKGILTTKGCPDVQIEGNLRKDEYFVDIPSNDSLFKSVWPCNCYIFYAKDAPLFKPFPPSGPLVSLAQPAFPDAYSAIRSIVGLDLEHSSQFRGAVVFVLPKYEARIREVRLGKKEISIDISTREAALNEVVGKVYYDRERGENSRQEDVIFDEESKSVPLEFVPDTIYLWLLSKKTGKRLDHRRISLRWPTPQKDVIIEVTTDEIQELIRRGENETVEFKEKVTDEFVETAVAFSNTYGGTLLAGVNDHGEIIGIGETKREEEKVRNLLRSHCEPPVEPDVKEKSIYEKPILVVQIKEGENKPYTFRGKGVYVRSGSTDRIATRDELDEIYERKKSESTALRSKYQ